MTDIQVQRFDGMPQIERIEPIVPTAMHFPRAAPRHVFLVPVEEGSMGWEQIRPIRSISGIRSNH
jgi:hypothetical protein